MIYYKKFKKIIYIFEYQGDIDDVLSRYYYSAKKYNLDIIVRVTSDCPLIDYRLIDEIINFYNKNNVDYVSNTIEDSYPDGQDVEVFSMSALTKSFKEAKRNYREYVTFLLKNEFLKRKSFH